MPKTWAENLGGEPGRRTWAENLEARGFILAEPGKALMSG